MRSVKKLTALAATSLLAFVHPAAAQVAISQLPAASALGGTEVAPVVQSGSTVKATMNQIATYVKGGGGAVSTTGAPATGNLAKFSAAQTITNGDLSGDCTTAGALAITCTKTGGVAFGALATSTDAANLTGTVSVNRFNSGTGASSSTFLRGDGTWVAPSAVTQYATFQNQQTANTPSGGGGGAESIGTSLTTMILNTTVNNTISGSTLSANQISLPAGTYQVSARVPIGPLTLAAGRCVIQNITDAATLLYGQNEYIPSNAAATSDIPATVIGVFVLSGTKTVALQCLSTATQQVGTSRYMGTTPETYETLTLAKIG